MIGVLALQGAFLEHLVKLRELGCPCCTVRTPEELAACDGLIIPGGESTAITLIAQRLGMWEPLRDWVAARRPTWGTCAGMIMLCREATGTKIGGQPLLQAIDAKVHRNHFGAQRASFEAPLELDPSISSIVAPSHPFVGVFIRSPAFMELGVGVLPLAWVAHAAGDAQVPDLSEAVAALTSTATATHPETTDATSTVATAFPEHGSGCGTGTGTGPASGPGSASSPDRVVIAARAGPFLATAFHPELTPDGGWHRLFATIVEETTHHAQLGTSSSGETTSGKGGMRSGTHTHGGVLSDLPIVAGVAAGGAHAATGVVLTPGTSLAASFRFASTVT